MTLPGSFSVNGTGAATYTIPISVPPGTAGMVPSLTLSYSSQNLNGLLGIGWSLDGLPSIGRCPQTMAQDGVVSGVNYTASDRFCFEGQRLVVISGSYGADGSEYRTEIDSYSRILSHGAAGTGPAWFEVHTKSGQVMEFGHTADSQILAQGRPTARSWAVDKVSDSKGNYFTVSYVNDTTNGQAYPSRIDYTGNAAANLATYNSVQFVYASRPDISPQYQAGSLSQTTMRLTDIETFNGSAMVADYRLAYQLSSTSSQSQLVSVTLCAGGGSCLPATTFQWTGGSVGSFSGAVMYITNGENFGTPPAAEYLPISGDFNGDGKTDFLMLSGPYLYGFLSNGDGTYTIVNSDAPNGWNFGAGAAPNFTLITGDFNADGKTEFALLLSGYVYVFLSNGNGTFSGVTLPCPGGWNFGTTPNTMFTLISGDFNADGRSDFLMLGGAYLYVFLSNGDGTFAGKTVPCPDGWNFGTQPNQSYTPVSGDFNGDGKTDFLMMGGPYLFPFMSNGDGTFSGNTILISNGWNFGNPPSAGFMPITGDFNGDGKADFVMVQGPYVYEFLSRGDGSFIYNTIEISNGWNFGSPVSSSYTPISGDFNADGKADFALIGGAYVYEFISSGDGTFRYNTVATANSWNVGNPPSASFTLLGGDFNGDGNTDFAFMDATHIYTNFIGGGAFDVITTTTSGLGAANTMTYAPLTSASIYSKDNTASYPVQDMQSPLYVVSRVDSSNGIGGTYSATYGYAGAKLDLSGRGFLGFRQTSTTDLQTSIVQITNYGQAFPYIGLLTSTTKSLNALTLNQANSTYQFSNASGAATLSSPTNSSAPYRVSVAQSVSSSFDLDGSQIPPATTSYQYDAYGNATQVVVSTPDGFSKTTANTYSNDTTHWWLGRLTAASVSSVAP